MNSLIPPRFLKVCVPSPSSSLTHRLLPGSAIVTTGNIVAGDQAEVYYEGNMHGASNLCTFAEKAGCAADRLLTRYPTVARTLVAWSELLVVGTYDPETRRLTLDRPELSQQWEVLDGPFVRVANSPQ